MFKRPGGKRRPKGTPEYAARLEHGFSQIVDWFYTLDDLRTTSRFRDQFGTDLAGYAAVLVAGRDAHLSPAELDRLRWRSQAVFVNGRPVACYTYDQLYHLLESRIAMMI